MLLVRIFNSRVTTSTAAAALHGQTDRGWEKKKVKKRRRGGGGKGVNVGSPYLEVADEDVNCCTALYGQTHLG